MAGAAALVACVAGGCSAEEERGEASCAAAVSFQGERLVGLQLDPKEIARLPRVVGTRTAQRGSCRDAGQGDGGVSDVELEELEGVPPQAALRHREELYLGEGFLIGLRGHPLHRVFRSSRRPSRRDCHPRRLSGEVTRMQLVAPFFSIRDARGRERVVNVLARARVRLPETGGLPRLRLGLRVHARGEQCRLGHFFARAVSG